MEHHMATVWEAVARAVPDRLAVVQGERRRTWRQHEERAARIHAALDTVGIGLDQKVGLYLYNSVEYCEATFGSLKARAVPINVNYRYLDDELWYLLDNADAEALVYHASLGDRVERVRPRLPKLRLLVEVDDGGPSVVDGAVRYDDLLAALEPAAPVERSDDEIHMLYTGGTTGMPKGVMYVMGDFVRATLGSLAAGAGLPAAFPLEELEPTVRDLDARGEAPVVLPVCPLMHGTGFWVGYVVPHYFGATEVLLEGRKFDPHEAWQAVEREGVTMMVIVGDAFARPLVAALDEGHPDGRPYDLSSLRDVRSAGVMWSAEVKAAMLDHAPHLTLRDGMGASEGSMALSISRKGETAETATFRLNPGVKVLDDDDQPVEPGSGQAGRVALRGGPIGYYKDPEKSARTFRLVDGVRHSFPGDLATVEADGTITLLGRGSQVINTGGEKVFAEEVEETVKRHPSVDDCLVVGVPDERFGERVIAVASGPGGAIEDDVLAHCRAHLAGYKVPRRVVFVDTVPRAPNGKADYKTARAIAAAQAEGVNR